MAFSKHEFAWEVRLPARGTHRLRLFEPGYDIIRLPGVIGFEAGFRGLFILKNFRILWNLSAV